MKPGVALAAALFLASALPAQNRSGFVRSPGVTTSFGNVLLPGGTSALPGVQRTTGNILHPGGGGSQIGIPGIPYVNMPPTPRQGIQGFHNPAALNNGHWGNGRPGFGYGSGYGYGGGYAYPVYVQPYYDQDLYQPQEPAQPVVVYPPQPAPVIINQYPSAPPATRIFDLPGRQQQEQAEPADDSNEPVHYMLAFKDHSVYAAVAYWVEGDTLHYFTEGNTHNQASLALVDRVLTDRLNKGTGVQVKLPAVK